MNLIDYGRKKWDYLLKADFGGANSGTIASGTSIETASSGSVQAGTLTAYDVGSGTVQVTSNELVIDPNIGGWGQHGVYSGSISRDRGLLLRARFKPETTASDTAFGLSPNTSLSVNYWGIHWNTSASLGAMRCRWDDGAGTSPGSITAVSGYSASFYDVAILIGGYSSSVPWDGSSAGYSEGASWFRKSGPNWLLDYKIGYGSWATLYFNATCSTKDLFLDNIVIPNADLSSLLQPLVLDTFTDTNGTALTAHTPDVDVVGGGWTVVNGTWEINAGGYVEQQLNANSAYHATIDPGKSDIFIESVMRVPSSVAIMWVMYRYADASNYWSAEINESPNTFKIRERVSGTLTDRASASVAIGTTTNYLLKISAKGAEIKAWLDDANGITYGSATNHETETMCGLGHYANTGYNDPWWDNFAVYPIGTNGEYSDLDRY